MASTTTQTSIANRGLQILGYPSINSITENSKGARAMLRAYQPVLLATLRENIWGFAVKRAILAAAVTPPLFGRANYFQLPGDYLDIVNPDPDKNFNTRDWQIENNGNGPAICTNDRAPLYVRYISSAITEGAFDPLFAEALSANLAYSTCEELTQSNTKLAAVGKIYDDAIQMARKRNAIEGRPEAPPVDTWLTKRL